MAGIKFSRKEFEKHFKITEELKEKISLFGTHFESVDNESVELEILPNRPDLFSLKGFIQGFSAFLGKNKEKGIKKYKINPPEKNFQVKIDKSVLEVRPFTACTIVKNIKFDEEKIKEVIDIQEKIHTTYGRNRKKIAIGIYPLEKIKLPITFKALKPKEIKFIPLETDKEMNGLEILQKHPAGREYAHLLEGKEKFPVFVDANDEVLSMPPIINSHKTGKITEQTKEIFIECSGFDLEILKKSINILAAMFAEMSGEIYQMKILHPKTNYITPDLISEKIKINLDNVNKLLGTSLNEKQIKDCLEKMGHNYSKGIAEVAAWRTDVMHEVDLIGDIAIAYGYENFKPEIPQIATAGEIDRVEIAKRKISDILIGLNMLETSAYHLLTKDDVKLFNIKEAIEMENSKSEYKILKPSLLISNLKILSQNIDSEYPQRIFELARVFNKDSKEETGIKEKERLCITVASTNSNFTEVKQIFDYLARMLNKNYTIKDTLNPLFIDGRCGKVIVNNQEIGYLGEINLQMLSNLRIKMPVAALEIDIDELIK